MIDSLTHRCNTLSTKEDTVTSQRILDLSHAPLYHVATFRATGASKLADHKIQ